MTMKMEMKMSMSMDGNAMPDTPMPVIIMGADLNVTNVSATGDVTYAFAYTGVSLPDGLDPMMSSVLQGLDADYKTVTGTVTVSDRGISRALQIDASKVSNPMVSQLLGASSNSAENISMPLPEEAVGIGARWEVKQSLSAGGLQQVLKTEYEILSFDGTTLTLKTKIEQSAPPQPLSNAALPAGVEASLKKLTGGGAGTVKIRLDSLVPTSDANMTTTQVAEISTMGTTVTLTTETSVRVSIAPLK